MVAQKHAAQHETSLNSTPLSTVLDRHNPISTGVGLVDFDLHTQSRAVTQLRCNMSYTAFIIAIAVLSFGVTYRNRAYATYASLKFLINGRRMLIEAAAKVSHNNLDVATMY